MKQLMTLVVVVQRGIDDLETGFFHAGKFPPLAQIVFMSPSRVMQEQAEE